MDNLKCSGTKECTCPVTHIDEKGFIYCSDHGKLRKMYMRCRKLTKSELKTLEDKKPIKKY